MPARRSSKSAKDSVSGAEILSQEILQRATSDVMTNAKIAHLTHLLKETTESEASDSVRQLLNYREALTKEVKFDGLHTLSDPSVIQLNKYVVDIADLLSPWSSLKVCILEDNYNEVPRGPRVNGSIETTGLSRGGVTYGTSSEGLVNYNQSSQDPIGGGWWIHNWKCTTVFPAAPYPANLYYRFTVDAEANLYHQSMRSGRIFDWVTLAESNDSANAPKNYHQYGWCIDSWLPMSGFPSLRGSQDVTGSIRVAKGKQAVLGLLYGVGINVAGGLLHLAWANMGTRVTLPSSSVIKAYHYGKIEYRFEPVWLVEAVSRYLQEVIGHFDG
ncbi:MAG: hypothetical protein U0670_06855 [Anaerolineae bacterium]